MSKLIPEFLYKGKGARIAKTILKKTLEDSHYLISRFTIKSIVIKIAWFWPKDRHIDQWNIKSTELNPQKYGQLIFESATKAIQWRKVNFFYQLC